MRYMQEGKKKKKQKESGGEKNGEGQKKQEIDEGKFDLFIYFILCVFGIESSLSKTIHSLLFRFEGFKRDEAKN